MHIFTTPPPFPNFFAVYNIIKNNTATNDQRNKAQGTFGL